MRPSSSSAKWQAERCSASPIGRSGGSSSRQRTRPCERKQRGWNGQPGGRLIRLGGCPGNRSQPLLLRRQLRQAVHQPDRVRMARRAEDRVHVTELDDLAGVHDDHAIGELGDQAEVVRDQDRGGVRLVLRLLQHLEDLSLDGHVERRRRLVGDQHGRLVRDRHRDHRALAHSTRELVRILVDPPLGIRDADELEQRHRPLLDRVVLDLRMVGLDRLADLEADLQDRVQRRHRILEDHRELVAPNAAQLLLRNLEQVLALEHGLAADDASRRLRDQPEDRHRADALA